MTEIRLQTDFNAVDYRNENAYAAPQNRFSPFYESSVLVHRIRYATRIYIHNPDYVKPVGSFHTNIIAWCGARTSDADGFPVLLLDESDRVCAKCERKARMGGAGHSRATIFEKAVQTAVQVDL